MLDALGVERAAAAEDAMNEIPFAKQELGEIRAVLTGDAGDEGFFSCGGWHGLIVTGHLSIVTRWISANDQWPVTNDILLYLRRLCRRLMGILLPIVRSGA